MKAVSCLRLRALRLGLLVYHQLPQAPVIGSVHSAFTRAVNLCHGDRLWLCLHDERVALHPYSVVVEGSFFESVSPGEQVAISSVGMEFLDSGIEVEIGLAPIWDSRLRPFDESPDCDRAEPADGPMPGRDAVSGETFGHRMHRAACVLRRVAAERRSASPFLSALSCSEVKLRDAAADSGASRDSAASCDFFGVRAAQLASRLTQAWTCGRDDLAGVLGTQLVGFGPGLTPSGDDLLLGILGAYHCFSRTSEDADRHARFVRVLRGRLPALLSSTTIQSRLMLEAALCGHYPAPVSGLLASIAEGGEDEIRESVERLRNVGATSGEDVLAGILLWLETRARCESL